MKRIVLMAALVTLVGLGCRSTSVPSPTATEFKVNALFTDNMVVQREMKVPVWGEALPGEVVVVSVRGKKFAATAGNDGKWRVDVDALPVGGPYTMTVAGKNRKITYKDVLCGDVWICSGQSNMQWSVGQSANAKKEIAAAKYPQIRLFQVRRTVSQIPLLNVTGKWQECKPQTVKNFTAVGYYFGRDLYKDLKVPIGLIHSSWGGTPAEAWTKRELLETDPILKPIVDRHNKNLKAYPKRMAVYNKKMAELKKKGLSIFVSDAENKGLTQGWNKLAFKAADWKTMKLPQLWERIINIDGAVWFRREVNIPKDWAGKQLQLSLGPIDDFDQTFYNGVLVGRMGVEVKDAWKTPREYKIPGKLVKPGKAVIAVRVFDRYGGGGIYGEPASLFVKPVDGGNKISLAGNWKYKIEKKFDPRKVRWPRKPYGPEHPHLISGLYNAMINPLIPYGIKGAIWYQGESNAWRAWQYRTLLPTMINCWRKEWNQGDFPFLIVQLANFKKANAKPVESSWAELREAQALTAEKLPNCGLAVAIDIGEANDIHPKNKQDVGKRLELAALKVAYGKNVVFSGPTYLSHEIKGNKVFLAFSNIGGGLVAKGGPLKRFEVAGADRKFVWAKAEIRGSKVQVWSPKVERPVAVRYAWSDNPAGCNLYNKEGLPAVPFRTDGWPGKTDRNR